MAHAGIDPPIKHELICRGRLLEMREMRAWMRFCRIKRSASKVMV
jgi:hypothetical protein